MSFVGKSILSCDQFDLDGLERICRVAGKMEPIARRRKTTRVLEGAVLANLFFEASTRTRISFGAAFNRLGGAVRDTTGFQFSSISKGESLADTARVISGYADVIVLRHPTAGAVGAFAQAARVPVINGGDGDGEHPTQALLDYYTIQKELALQSRTIDGITVAFLGDLLRGRTVHSLLKVLKLHRRMTFVLCAPGSLRLPDGFARDLEAAGHRVIDTEDVAEAVGLADILYVTRIQSERGGVELSENFIPTRYRVDSELISACAKPGCIILHPLPRSEEASAADLSSDVREDQGLRIFQQSDNGVPVRMALFALVLDVAERVDHELRDVAFRSLFDAD